MTAKVRGWASLWVCGLPQGSCCAPIAVPKVQVGWGEAQPNWALPGAGLAGEPGATCTNCTLAPANAAGRGPRPGTR